MPSTTNPLALYPHHNISSHRSFQYAIFFISCSARHLPQHSVLKHDQLVFFYISWFVDRASLYNRVNKNQLDAQLILSIGWRTMLRTSCASSWFFFTRLFFSISERPSFTPIRSLICQIYPTFINFYTFPPSLCYLCNSLYVCWGNTIMGPAVGTEYLAWFVNRREESR